MLFLLRHMFWQRKLPRNYTEFITRELRMSKINNCFLFENVLWASKSFWITNLVLLNKKSGFKKYTFAFKNQGLAIQATSIFSLCSSLLQRLLQLLFNSCQHHRSIHHNVIQVMGYLRHSSQLLQPAVPRCSLGPML
jgi:hypothetical protein